MHYVISSVKADPDVEVLRKVYLQSVKESGFRRTSSQTQNTAVISGQTIDESPNLPSLHLSAYGVKKHFLTQFSKLQRYPQK